MSYKRVEIFEYLDDNWWEVLVNGRLVDEGRKGQPFNLEAILRELDVDVEHLVIYNEETEKPKELRIVDLQDDPRWMN
jgi:hypothetical protein